MIHPSLKSMAAPWGFLFCSELELSMGANVAKQWSLLCWHRTALTVPLSSAEQTLPGWWAPVPVPPLPTSLLTLLHVHVLLPGSPRAQRWANHDSSMAQTRGSTGGAFFVSLH